MLTCAGGVISPSHIESLRVNPEGRRVRVVGTDMTVPCVGQYLADTFYRVPSGTSPEYVTCMLEICQREGVNVVFPASHEEALALARRREALEQLGVVLAVSRYEVLDAAFNKKRAYQTLRDHGLPCPDYRVARNLSEFKAAADALGIERSPVVMKPVLTRGGRGARILTRKGAERALLNEKPGYLEADYDEVTRVLSRLQEEAFPELILMEYLPGPIYSVDFLAKAGEPLAVVPKVRLVGNPSQTLVGVVKRDAYLEEQTKRISRVFGFDYTVNIEFACDKKGVPLPFDLNPRVAASVAFCTAAGANLLYYALKMALGEDVPKLEVKDGVMMLRYFKELYVHPAGQV